MTLICAALSSISIQSFKNNSNDNILRYKYHIMKKRIRKKRHVGEFKNYGNVIILKTQGEEETAATILEKLEPIIEKFSLNVAGGGTGRLLIPPKKGNKTIPNLAGTVVSIVVDESYPSDQMMFCVYVKRTSEVPQAALDAIKETFADEKYGVQIGKSIDLWH